MLIGKWDIQEIKYVPMCKGGDTESVDGKAIITILTKTS